MLHSLILLAILCGELPVRSLRYIHAPNRTSDYAVALFESDRSVLLVGKSIKECTTELPGGVPVTLSGNLVVSLNAGWRCIYQGKRLVSKTKLDSEALVSVLEISPLGRLELYSSSKGVIVLDATKTRVIPFRHGVSRLGSFVIRDEKVLCRCTDEDLELLEVTSGVRRLKRIRLPEKSSLWVLRIDPKVGIIASNQRNTYVFDPVSLRLLRSFELSGSLFCVSDSRAVYFDAYRDYQDGRIRVVSLSDGSTIRSASFGRTPVVCEALGPGLVYGFLNGSLKYISFVDLCKASALDSPFYDIKAVTR